MKTLLLMSSGKFLFSNDVDDYLPIPLSQSRIAYITTAAKKVNDAGFVTRQKAGMDALKLHYTELDIANKSKDEIESALQGFDVLFMEGGNAYYLLHVIRQTGFEHILRKLLEQKVVYMSSSAGSYVASLSIEIATWTERGFDRFGITEYTAMGLVPFVIKAHYTLDKHEIIKKHVKSFHLPIKVISDKQALLVQGDKVTLVGDAKVIKI
jgi:dipeptidase E